MHQVVDGRTPADQSELTESAREAIIYTRMGVVFHAQTWRQSTYGVSAEGEWSTPGPAALEVFIPWTSVDSIRFA